MFWKFVKWYFKKFIKIRILDEIQEKKFMKFWESLNEIWRKYEYKENQKFI